MCVGWLSAMLTGHMTPFWNPWDQTSTLGVIISINDHSQDYQEGLECTQVGHLEEIGCLKEYFVVFIWQTLTWSIFE